MEVGAEAELELELELESQEQGQEQDVVEVVAVVPAVNCLKLSSTKIWSST